MLRLQLILILVILNVNSIKSFLNIFNNKQIIERINLIDNLNNRLRYVKSNGINVKPEIKKDIENIVNSLEKLNPTKDPAYSPLMNGFWKMLYTDFDPPGPSSGKLGPFIGDVYQDLDSTKGIITNILKVNFPPIVGGLVAEQSIENKNTWRIKFDRIGNSIFGIKLPTTYFKPGTQIRLWEIVYLDDSLRILRARKIESDRKDSYIFKLVRRDEQKFTINL